MTKAQKAAAQLAAMVDELGELERETQPWRPKLARVEALRSAVRAVYAKSDPGATYKASGRRWICMVGPNGNQSTVDRAALIDIIGAKKYAELSTVSVKALSGAIGADVLGVVVTMQPAGPRSLAIVPVEAPVEAPELAGAAK